MRNDFEGSIGDLVNKTHPSMQGAITGTQKNKQNQSSSDLAPAPVSVHSGWDGTRAHNKALFSIVWMIGSHRRLL